MKIITMSRILLSLVFGLYYVGAAAAAEGSVTSSFSDVISRFMHADEAGTLRGNAAEGNKKKDPIAMIKEAVAGLEQDDDMDDTEDDSDIDPDVDAFLSKFNLNDDESDEEADEPVVGLSEEVEEAIERHVQQEIAKDMLAFEDSERRLGVDGELYEIRKTCPEPKVPAQNFTCVEIIEDAFEKDLVKITRKKEKKLFKIQEEYDEAVGAVSEALTEAASEEVLNEKCGWEEANASGDLAAFRACIKQQVRIDRKEAANLQKQAKKRRNKKSKKQLSLFEKKDKKLTNLRIALLPRCDICVEPLDANGMGGVRDPRVPSVRY